VSRNGYPWDKAPRGLNNYENGERLNEKRKGKIKKSFLTVFLFCAFMVMASNGHDQRVFSEQCQFNF